ncbi:MAG: glycosyltransferase family 4 protein [Bacillota bacterium]
MAKVLVTDNAHVFKTCDGKYYTPSIYDRRFFQRYLNVFQSVRFVAKTKYVDNIDPTRYIPLDFERVEVFELPWYRGIGEMLRQLPKLVARCRLVCDDCDCYVFRVAQIESFFAFLLSRRRPRPYVVEVVNDPASFLRASTLLRWFAVFMVRIMVRRANGVAYVTERYLQRAYPRHIGKSDMDTYFESSYSSIELDQSDILAPRKFPAKLVRLRLIHVSNTIDDGLKGHWTVIRAVQLLSERGYDVVAKFVGDGSLVANLRQYVEEAGLTERVVFVGRLYSRNEVMKHLVDSDLFLFPSYSEGLPRVIIEAQAAGLPCLSTPVGGIPELLESKYLFEPDDFRAFAAEIERLINTPAELEEMSLRNIGVARQYTAEKLEPRRTAFYSRLLMLAERVITRP